MVAHLSLWFFLRHKIGKKTTSRRSQACFGLRHIRLCKKNVTRIVNINARQRAKTANNTSATRCIERRKEEPLVVFVCVFCCVIGSGKMQKQNLLKRKNRVFFLLDAVQ